VVVPPSHPNLQDQIPESSASDEKETFLVLIFALRLVPWVAWVGEEVALRFDGDLGWMRRTKAVHREPAG
jgi:hypothetical protein